MLLERNERSYYLCAILIYILLIYLKGDNVYSIKKKFFIHRNTCDINMYSALISQCIIYIYILI